MTDMFRIPKLAETADGKVVVTHWGQASSLLFRVGDRLILNQDRADGLLILRTKGWGNPMFGRRSQGQLLAEPSGAPASPLRWSVQGSVEAVERDLERGGVGPPSPLRRCALRSVDAPRAGGRRPEPGCTFAQQSFDVKAQRPSASSSLTINAY